jgi:hypothetical protein
MNYLLLLINNYINKIQSESFFVPVSIVIVICITRSETARLRA